MALNPRCRPQRDLVAERFDPLVDSLIVGLEEVEYRRAEDGTVRRWDAPAVPKSIDEIVAAAVS
jgi:hypothetical protein